MKHLSSVCVFVFVYLFLIFVCEFVSSICISLYLCICALVSVYLYLLQLPPRQIKHNEEAGNGSQLIATNIGTNCRDTVSQMGEPLPIFFQFCNERKM